MRLIKNIALFVTVLVSLPLSVWSQGGGPTFSFTSEAPCTGDDFCIDVTVEDFTDILAIKFPVTWDTSVVEFQSITNFGLPGMNLSDFDLSTVNQGLIRVNWQFDDCEVATQGSTIQDDVIIFTLCFRAIGDYGAVTNVTIINQDTVLLGDPDPVNIQRFGIDCSIDIQINRVNPGVVSTCVIPVELYATNSIGNTGELVSIDIKSRGFTDLNALQFTMVWDSTILQLEEVIPLEALINLNTSNFGTPFNNINVPRGNMTFTWNYIDPTGNDLGATLTNDESFFTMNFRIIGDCETSSAVGIDVSTAALTPLEAISSRVENGQVINDNIPLLTTNGQVATGACTPDGLILFTDCGSPTGLDSTVCVTISAGAINDLTDIRYLMEWNASILEYQGVNILTNSMQGLGQGNFDASNASNGILELDWSSLSSFFNASFTEGEDLYEVCFKVVGLGGNSPFRIDPTAPAARVRSEGSFIPVGLFPNNCEVQVNQPPGVTINLSDTQAPQGDTMCVDVTAANFNELVNLQFSLSWGVGCTESIASGQSAMEATIPQERRY
ncbi:MAG: cohesin domain-containing protein [Bacteroidota bacterium]